MEENNLKAIFANNLRKYTKAKGCTFTELANAIGVGKSAVSNWLNGISLPRMDKIDMICDYLQITKNDLLEDTNSDLENSFKINKIQRQIDNREIFINWIRSIGITCTKRQPKSNEPSEGYVFIIKNEGYFLSHKDIDKLMSASINSVENLISLLGKNVNW